MALKSIAFVGVPKGKPDKRYVRLNKDVTLIAKLGDGTEITLPPGSYLQMFSPRKSEKQTDEQFQELLQWKRFDILLGTDE
jgi:hypothetical protein